MFRIIHIQNSFWKILFYIHYRHRKCSFTHSSTSCSAQQQQKHSLWTAIWNTILILNKLLCSRTPQFCPDRTTYLCNSSRIFCSNNSSSFKLCFFRALLCACNWCVPQHKSQRVKNGKNSANAIIINICSLQETTPNFINVIFSDIILNPKSKTKNVFWANIFCFMFNEIWKNTINEVGCLL